MATMKVNTKLNGQIEVDKEDVDAMAESLVQLSEIEAEVKKQISAIKKALLPKKPLIYFPAKGKKVVFTEGKTQSYLDVNIFYTKLKEKGYSASDFLKLVSVKESDVRSSELEKNVAEELIAASKKEAEKGKDSVTARAMTKEELKQHSAES